MPDDVTFQKMNVGGVNGLLLVIVGAALGWVRAKRCPRGRRESKSAERAVHDIMEVLQRRHEPYCNNSPPLLHRSRFQWYPVAFRWPPGLEGCNEHLFFLRGFREAHVIRQHDGHLCIRYEERFGAGSRMKVRPSSWLADDHRLITELGLTNHPI